MPRGGKRPGAGVKKGTKLPKTLDKLAARERYRQKVMERFDPLIEAQLDAAMGAHQFVYTDDKGRFKVIDDPDELRACINMGRALRLFTRLPNVTAQQDLLNRVLDKPAEQEQQHEHKGTIVLKHEL